MGKYPSTIDSYGKRFFLDSVNTYSGFKKRLTLLKKVHPKLKYKYTIHNNNGNKTFCLYVRRWGT